MSFWSETNWYAIQTKPHREGLAAAAVEDLDLEAFFPRVRCEQSVCGVVRGVNKQLFPGYLFARFCPSLSLDAVRYARGVLRIVGDHRHPIPIEEGVVSEIRARALEDGLIRLEARQLRPGAAVSIEQGPFAGLMGRVERELDDHRRVAILLEAIGDARLLIAKSAVTLAAS